MPREAWVHARPFGWQKSPEQTRWGPNSPATLCGQKKKQKIKIVKTSHPQWSSVTQRSAAFLGSCAELLPHAFVVSPAWCSRSEKHSNKAQRASGKTIATPCIPAWLAFHFAFDFPLPSSSPSFRFAQAPSKGGGSVGANQGQNLGTLTRVLAIVRWHSASI